jgi:tetratricopeptide (TPR) repeat protein
MPPIPTTPSQPPDAILGSRVPPPASDALREVAGLLARLRAEVAGASEPSRKARLLYEIGEIEERSADEPAAARDYLAAFNIDGTFREPIEGLLRLLERRRSLRNLGRLVDALAKGAETPDEEVRAKVLRAYFLEDVGGDAQTAKQAAVDATLVTGAAPAEAAMAWLTLELIAARVGDSETRMGALAKRPDLAKDPTWRALLRIDAAKLHAGAGEVDAALEALRAARAEGAGATFAAAIAGERLARRSGAGADPEGADKRARAFAEALEVQAGLIDEALTSPGRGDALGVPRWARSPVTMVDAWLRAAEARSLAGEDAAAATLLDRAREALARFEGDAGRPALQGAIIDARIRVAERTGDTGLAAQLAEERLASVRGGTAAEDPSVGAALAMRVAEHAASEGDVPRALAALATATEMDPACIPARALQLDLLADDDPSTFANQLESLAEYLPTEEGRGRALLLAAWVWGARAGNAKGARVALGQASAAGVAEKTVARVARTLASLAGDAIWYEEATKRLLAGSGEDEPTEAERPMLWLELARARFARGALDEARVALHEVGQSPHGAWIGRALEAFLPPPRESGAGSATATPAGGVEISRSSAPPVEELETTSAVSGARALEALDELAARPQPPDVARGLVLMAAMRAHRTGDLEGARRRLRGLVAERADDVLVETYLAELERSRGALEAVAVLAERCADATDDAELAAALRIEAGLTRWRSGDRAGAIASFEGAIEAAPEAARAALAWAMRGVDADSADGRRGAIARALDGGGDETTLLLERFATELAAGEPGAALAALETAETSAEPAVTLAAALARATWNECEDDADALTRALALIAGAGPAASTIAAAEDHRRSRAAGDADRVLDSSRAWFHGGGGLPAGVEWLAATMAVGSTEDEGAARRALAAAVPPDLREPLLASASLLHVAATPEEPAPLLLGDSEAVRLVNLELAPPGCDPRRRLAALRNLDGALGPDAEIDAIALSGWSWLVEGNVAEALVAFDRATIAHPDDIASWEGLRTAAEAAGDLGKRTSACEELGARCKDDERAGAFWEEAGLTATTLGDDARAEAAFFSAFARDATRATSFDLLFRRVRERKERDLLLELVSRRLTVCDDPPEIAKLFWEQARVLREKGDQDGALKALENVTMLEPDHVGALALTGEIAIRRGKFEEAAEALARLALLADAPAKNRVTAGIAAVDLFENKLTRFDRALEILLALHRAKLSTLPVRERLARAAARTGSWKDATDILEELMFERPEAEGRIEAARLAMAIHRDRLQNPSGARPAIVKLLEESPTDGEAIEMLLAVDAPADVRVRLLENARKFLVESLQRRPLDLPSVKRLAKVARALSDEALQQIALSVAITLGGHDAALEQLFAQVAARKTRTPQIKLSEAVLKQLLDPGDRGPIARLFVALGPTLAEALGPSLAGCGVTKRDRVDPRSGLALRNEIATWAGAFGITDFDLYVGGRDPLDVQGIPGEPPALVVGAGVNAPLAPATRARVARELLAMVRGSTVVRHRDDTSVAAVVVASCNIADVKVDAPSYAMLADVERLLSKAISRKTKKLLPELCQAVVAANADARGWSKRALASHNRVAALASGDVGIALVDALHEPLDRLPTVVKGDPRAEELVRFALSPTYLELRRALGLEGHAGATP